MPSLLPPLVPTDTSSACDPLLAEVSRLRDWIDLRERIDRCIEAASSIEVLVDDVLDILADSPMLELRPDLGVFLVAPGDEGKLSVGTIREVDSRALIATRAQACNDLVFPEQAVDEASGDSLDPQDGHYVLQLTAHGSPIGALSLVVENPAGWAARWMPLLDVIGRQLGFAIDRIRSEEASERNQRALREAKARAERADRLKTDFLANMSHELRTPLNAIIGYSEMLEDELDELERPDLMDDVVRIRSAGSHLLELINNVLDLSKVEAGRMELDLEYFPVSLVCRDVANTMHPLVRANHNEFELDVQDELPEMHGDELKLRQILINLLGNATKFTENGHIRLRVRQIGDQLVFSVRDSGIGMSAEQVERVFTAFEQADTSTTRRFGGTGLGLSVSRRYADIMGGSLTCASRQGKGSTFTLRIPVHLKAS